MFYFFKDDTHISNSNLLLLFVVFQLQIFVINSLDHSVAVYYRRSLRKLTNHSRGSTYHHKKRKKQQHRRKQEGPERTVQQHGSGPQTVQQTPEKLKYKTSENPTSFHQTRAGGGVSQLPASTFWSSAVSSTENTVRADSHPAVCRCVCVCVSVCVGVCNDTNQDSKPGKTPWWRQRRKSADLPFFSE